MKAFSLFALGCAFASACSSNPTPDAQATPPADTSAAARAGNAGITGKTGQASAIVRSADNRDIGTLRIDDAGKLVTVSGTIRGLPPGTHGVHLHMSGMCEGPTFASAGEHFNPTMTKHGRENPEGPHIGDLSNVTVAADSSATFSVSTAGGSLSGLNPVLDADGAAVVFHASPDDYKTDPSGNSGDRIACGVITRN